MKKLLVLLALEAAALAAVPAVNLANTKDLQWGGWVDLAPGKEYPAPPNTTFQGIRGYFQVPAVNMDKAKKEHHPNNAAAFWAGLGGWNKSTNPGSKPDPLLQAGVVITYDQSDQEHPRAEYRPFWDVVHSSYRPPIPAEPGHASDFSNSGWGSVYPGEVLQVDISVWPGAKKGTTKVNMNVLDASHNPSWGKTFTIPWKVTPKTAEMIAERMSPPKGGKGSRINNCRSDQGEWPAGVIR